MLQTTAFFINQSYCLFRGDLLCLLPEEGVSFRRGAWVMFQWNAAQECLSSGGCPGLAQRSLLGSVCQIEVQGVWWVFEGLSLHPAAVSSGCGAGAWFAEEPGVELQSSSTPAALAALELLLRVILLSACSCWLGKQKHSVVHAHCIVLPQRLLSENMASEMCSSSSKTALSAFCIVLVNSLFVNELVKYSQNVNLFIIGTPFLSSGLPKML